MKSPAATEKITLSLEFHIFLSSTLVIHLSSEKGVEKKGTKIDEIMCSFTELFHSSEF